MRLQAIAVRQPSTRVIFSYGALKRSMFLADGFETAVGARNIVCAGAILRLQLDTALRVHATSLVDDAESFVVEVLKGKRIDRLKARDGRPLQDRVLVDDASLQHPWVSEVYEQASGFVHFSAKHLLTGLSPASAAAPSIVAVDLSTFHDASDSLYAETFEAFERAVELTNSYVERFLSEGGIQL